MGMTSTPAPCDDHECDGCRLCKSGRCCGRDRPGYVLPDEGTWAGASVGTLGVIDKNKDGKLLCHICGKGFHNLGSHATSHGTWTDEYKAYFGLAGQSLKSEWYIGRSVKRNRPKTGPQLHRRIPRTCEVCGGPVPWKSGRPRKTCSDACLKQRRLAIAAIAVPMAVRPKWRKLCSVCGKVVERRRPARGIPRTCSEECARRATRANKQQPSIRITKAMLQAEGSVQPERGATIV